MSTSLDPPWKQILEAYFPQFMAFFFPAVEAAIDWSQGFDFLDGELQQVTLESETGKRIVDKLVKVYLLDLPVSLYRLGVSTATRVRSCFSR